MSVWKVIIAVACASLLLFTGSIVYVLYPTITDVTDSPSFGHFVNRPLELNKKGFIYISDEGRYRFKPLLLSGNGNYPMQKKLTLPVGSSIVLKKFVTYKAAGENSLTELYGIGCTVLPNGEKIEFEYDWGTITADGKFGEPIWNMVPEKRLVMVSAGGH